MGVVALLAPLVLLAASPTPAPGRELTAGFLLAPGFHGSELVAAHDVLQHVRLLVKPAVKVVTIASGPRAVESAEGLRLTADATLEDAPPLDVLVLPGAERSAAADLQDERLRSWIRKKASEARYVVTLGGGAFLLAGAGFLDGRHATTFPADVARFRERFPLVKTLERYSFVHDGKCLTSQGGARTYDVALYLVELLFGEKVSESVGRGLALPWDASLGRFVVSGSPAASPPGPTRTIVQR